MLIGFLITKFQAVAVGMKSKKETVCFYLAYGCILQYEDEVKLLGIIIDFKLKFDLQGWCVLLI